MLMLGGYFLLPFTSCGVILLLDLFGFVNEQKLISLHHCFANDCQLEIFC